MPLNPMSLAIGAEATFVARSIDMDRDLTAGILEEAKYHKGSAFVEIYQNCNVFNDKAFEQLTNKETKVANRINLVHGEKTVFGEDGHKAVVIRNGIAQIVDTKDVDESEIYVHNIHEENPSIAFSLSDFLMVHMVQHHLVYLEKSREIPLRKRFMVKSIVLKNKRVKVN